MSEPIVRQTGDISVTAKYFGFAKAQASQLQANFPNQFINKNYKLRDYNSQGDPVDVLITIKLTPPFVSIYFDTQKTVVGQGISGLTIDEYNFANYLDPNGNYFAHLQRRPDVDPDRNFKIADTLYSTETGYGTYFGFNVDRAHYIYASRYTGEMKQIVQLLLASKRPIEYLINDGIYTDTLGKKWLIRIADDGNVYAKQINYDISVQFETLSMDLPDGTTTDIETLDYFLGTLPSMTTIYSWAYNATGKYAQNIAFDVPGKRTKRYKITINESVAGDVVTLSFDCTAVEDEEMQYDHRLNLFFSTFQQNYIKFKESIIDRDFFPIDTIDSETLFDVEYKWPLFVFYDENDEEKVVYYSYKRVKKYPSITGDYASLADYFYAGDYTVDEKGVPTGWLQALGETHIAYDNAQDDPFTGVNNFIGEELNLQIIHGFYINSTAYLATDNNGDLYTDYIFQRDNSSAPDTTHIIKNYFDNQPSIMTPYLSFTVDNYVSGINGKISDLNDEIKNYYDNVFMLNKKLRQGQFFNDIFTKINTDMTYINGHYATPYGPIIDLIGDITPFNNISFVPFLRYQDVDFAPFLYAYDNTAKTHWDNIIADYSAVSTELDNLISTLSSINSASYSAINNLFNDVAFMATDIDAGLVDFTDLNSKIATLNSNIASVNSTVESVNDSLLDQTLYFNGVDYSSFSSTIEDYTALVNEYALHLYEADSSNEAIHMVDEPVKMVTTYAVTGTGTSKSGYTENLIVAKFERFLSVIFEKKQSIKDRKITKMMFMNNFMNRSSFEIAKNEYTYDEVKCMPYDGVYSKIKNLKVRFDLCQTNSISAYAQTFRIDYTPGLDPVYTYDDATPDVSGFNYVSKNYPRVDTDGSPMSDYAMTFQGEKPTAVDNSETDLYINLRFYTNASDLSTTATGYAFDFYESISPTLPYASRSKARWYFDYILGDDLPLASGTDYEANANKSGISLKNIPITENFIDLKCATNESLYALTYSATFESGEFKAYNTTSEAIDLSSVNESLIGNKLFKTFSQDKIFNYPENILLQKDVNYDNYYFTYQSDGMSNNYIISPDFDTDYEKFIKLTNITSYNTIDANSNVVLVNFVGFAFY